MKLEKAIEILESGSWSGYDDEEIAEAVRMGAEALRETERNPTITSWHDFDRGYNIAKEKFSRPHGEWIPCSERLPEENICDDGYVEPSDYVLVFGDHGNYGVSRYWGNRRTKKTNPHSFSDWMDLEWFSQKPIAWMPLPAPYRKEGEAE